MSTGETASACLKILEANMTSEEFDASVRRNKLLHDCKTKGFKKLESLGFCSGGISQKPKPNKMRMDPFEFARMGAKLVNDGRITITAWAEKCGRNAGDLRYYCDKYDIELFARNNKVADREKIYRQVMYLVNRRGRRLKDASRRVGYSYTFIRNVLADRGRVYNSTTVKIEKVK